MVCKEPSPQAEHVRTTFELPASLWADKVYLVGDFNNWNPRTLPFQRVHNGIWRITLDLPARRRYAFRYLLDGCWCTDFHADGCVQNINQGINSFIDTTLPLENLAACTSHGMVHEAAYEKGMDFATKQHQ
jgi:hypothetical protein